MRELYEQKVPVREICQRLKVSLTTLYKAVWDMRVIESRRVKTTEHERKGKAFGKRTVTDEQVAQMILLRRDGMPTLTIAKKFGISRTRVCELTNGTKKT
jgi:DNA invertase Pin-like site-specific DNA recombinase